MPKQLGGSLIKTTPRCIDSIVHPWIRRAAKLARDGNFRNTTRKIILSGHKVIWEYWRRSNEEQIQSFDLAITADYLRRHREEVDAEREIFHKALLMSSACAKYITREPAPEGIFLITNKPTAGVLDFNSSRMLILFRPLLPNNLGPLFRSAAAFGWSPIILVEPCTDPFSLDCIRTSKGATLQVPFVRVKLDELADLLSKHNYETVITSSPQQPSPPTTTLPDNNHLTDKKIALILGNEYEGTNRVPSQLASKATKIWLPMTRLVESLNVSVAGGILMYSLRHPSINR